MIMIMMKMIMMMIMLMMMTKVSMTELTEETLLDISRQILLASAYLNQMGIINTNLTRDNVKLTEAGEVKLFNYGLGRLTNYGAWVDFPLGDPRSRRYIKERAKQIRTLYFLIGSSSS